MGSIGGHGSLEPSDETSGVVETLKHTSKSTPSYNFRCTKPFELSSMMSPPPLFIPLGVSINSFKILCLKFEDHLIQAIVLWCL